MFKIRNNTPGNLPIDLEKGSIILSSGQALDLEEHCSRKWIKSNPVIARLLSVSALLLVHDSEEKLTNAPIKEIKRITQPDFPTPVVKTPKKKKHAIASKKAREIIDLSESAPTPEVPHITEEPVEEKAPEESLGEQDKENDPVENVEKKKKRKRKKRSKKDSEESTSESFFSKYSKKKSDESDDSE